jgi:hypothetical protein
LSIETILIALLPRSLSRRYNASRLRTHAKAWSEAANAPSCTCGTRAWAPDGDTKIVGGQRLRRQFGVTDVGCMEIEQVTCTNCGATATLGQPVGETDDREDGESPWQFL